MLAGCSVVSGTRGDWTIGAPPPRENIMLVKIASALDVWFLETGPGMCNVVMCANTPKAILFDCGTLSTSASNRDIYVRNVVKGLNDNSITNLSIVVSHPDRDHYVLIPEIVSQWREPGVKDVGDVYYGGYPQEYNTQMVALFNNFDGQRPAAPQTLPEICPGASLFVASASAADPTRFNKNPRSLIVAFTYQAIKLVFAGDATGTTEANAISNDANGVLTDSTVVVASHHGSRTHKSNSPPYVQETNPRFVIYEAGAKQWSHPGSEVVTRYRNGGVAVPDDYTGIVSNQPAHAFRYGGIGGPTQTSIRGEYNTYCSGYIHLTSADGQTVTVTPEAVSTCKY